MKPKPPGSDANELARLRQEVERLKRKVEELTGERGNNPAVRKSDLATPV